MRIVFLPTVRAECNLDGFADFYFVPYSILEGPFYFVDIEDTNPDREPKEPLCMLTDDLNENIWTYLDYPYAPTQSADCPIAHRDNLMATVSCDSQL